MTYALGAGIAHYLGVSINWTGYLLGQVWVSLLQLGALFLYDGFPITVNAGFPERASSNNEGGENNSNNRSRKVALMSGMTSLTVLASLTVVLAAKVPLTPVAYLIMGFSLTGSLLYSIPPVRLAVSGYGELIVSVLVAFFAPAFAFTLQTGELHRLIAMSAFPLAALYLAMLLIFEMLNYARDVKYNRLTLLVRMGWQGGMLLHNILILSAFLLLLIAASYGFPWFVVLPSLIPFPLGLFQIWQIRRITGGMKPNWTAVTSVAVALFGSIAYLITFAFWTN